MRVCNELQVPSISDYRSHPQQIFGKLDNQSVHFEQQILAVVIEAVFQRPSAAYWSFKNIYLSEKFLTCL